MTPTFATPEDLARFLLGMGYEYEQVFKSVRKDFPLTPPNRTRRIMDDVLRKIAASDAAVDKAIEAEGASAVDAEHDLSKTMHNDQEG